MNHTEEATRLAQQCYDKALASRRPTRTIARSLLAKADPTLVEYLAVEFVVAEVQRTQRTATLNAERTAEVRDSEQRAESPQAGSWRKRADQEEERAMWLIEQSMNANIQRAVDRYTEEVKMQWTTELLDSTFALRDGTPVMWGDATVADHEERRKMFVDNARANIEGASRHEMALRDLAASGANTLREMIGAAA